MARCRPSFRRHGKKIRFQFAGDQVKVFQADNSTIQGAYTIDPSKRPAALDLGDVFERRNIRAIYRWDGDKLILCGDERARPTEFATKSGDSRILFVLVRDDQTTVPDPGWVQLFNGKDPKRQSRHLTDILENGILPSIMVVSRHP